MIYIKKTNKSKWKNMRLDEKKICGKKSGPFTEI